jgi:alpha-1,6-mannosyltransferase
VLGAPDVQWYYDPHLPGAHGLFYAGMVALCVAWFGLGRELRAAGGRRLWIAGVLWCLPLALAPAPFSRDIYSYLAQGEILHLDLNPYHDGPAVLAAHGHGHLLAAVSPFWRQTTAPYGPLFLGITAPIAGATSAHLIAGVLLARLFELAGVALIALSAPRLARALGADPLRAAWLAALSPLVLLQLVAAGHNDALMVGLMVAGVALAVDGRRLAGVAVCAVAAGIKVPALAAIAFIAVAWAWEELEQHRGRGAALRALAGCGGVTLAVLAVISAATGVGTDWLTSGVFSTPQKVHLAITPGTAIGYTVASVLHDLGFNAGTRSLENAFNAVTSVAVLIAGLVLLWRVRRERLVLYLGAFLAIAAFGGPAAWPWYLTWGFALLAACPAPQRSRLLAAAVALPVFLIKPNGILALSVTASVEVFIVYLIAAALAWRVLRRRRRRALAGSAPVGAPPPLEPVA